MSLDPTIMGSNLSNSQVIDVVDVIDVECGRTLPQLEWQVHDHRSQSIVLFNLHLSIHIAQIISIFKFAVLIV